MKRILIPTDFSNNAGDALDYALNFSKKQPVALHVIYVINPTIVPVDVVGTALAIDNERLHTAEQAMEALEIFGASFIKKFENKDSTITTSVEVGVPAFAIKNKAKELGADLIIMGTQGSAHNFFDKVVGTVSTEVMNHAPCPVLLVPKDYKFATIDNVVFSTNLNHSDPYELWKAVELLKPNIACIRCLYVSSDKDEEDEVELEDFSKYLTQNSPSIQTIFDIKEGKALEPILQNYSETHSAELIIMHRSKKSIWARLFSTRHTKNMTFWSSVPLLVMN